MDKMFDKAIETLGTSLDYRLLRNNITNGNVANATTPDYKAIKVDFEKAMQDAADTDNNGMLTSDGNHFAQGGGGMELVEPEIYENPAAEISNDGNTVDIDAEMAKLAQNQLLYEATSKLINKKMGMLKYAITEGGK